MSDFFSRFAGFEPNPKAPAKEEFARLATYRGWKKGAIAWRREWLKFALHEFLRHYGTLASKLEGWQALCREVRVEGPTDSITKCKKALKKVHVNIVDLIDARRTGKPVRKFHNKAALRNYTINEDKIFPKAAAKKDGFLNALLREIF